MGVKSPSHHRPSAAALIKRSGRLSVDRGRIQANPNVLTETSWPETQKKLSEMMSRLLARTARRSAKRCPAPDAPAPLHRAVAMARIS